MKTGRILKAAADKAVRSTVNAEPHPEPDTLLGYARGEIGGDAKEKLQEHLSLCSACATAILDLRAFPDNPPSSADDLSDREIDAEWLRLVGKERGPKVGAKRFWSATGLRSGALGYGLAATFLVALLGLSAWTASLQGRLTDLSKPRVNVFVAHMADGDTRAPSPATEIPPDAKYVRFQLPVKDLLEYESYRISVRDANGREVIGNSEIRRSPGGEFSIEVEASQLPVGTGSIYLFGSSYKQETMLGEYAFSKTPQ